MNKKTLVIAAIAIVVSLTMEAQAQPREHSTVHDWDVDSLDKICQSNSDNTEDKLFRIVCLSYVQGAIRGLETGSNIVAAKYKDRSMRQLCVPRGVPLDMLTDYVIARMHEGIANRQITNGPAPVLIAAILQTSYPCDANGNEVHQK
jgi:hypothetical protein